MFYAQIIELQGIPLPVALPDEEDLNAIREAREVRDLMEADCLLGALEERE